MKTTSKIKTTLKIKMTSGLGQPQNEDNLKMRSTSKRKLTFSKIRIIQKKNPLTNVWECLYFKYYHCSAWHRLKLTRSMTESLEEAFLVAMSSSRSDVVTQFVRVFVRTLFFLVSLISQGSFKGISRKFQGYFEGV